MKKMPQHNYLKISLVSLSNRSDRDGKRTEIYLVSGESELEKFKGEKALTARLTDVILAKKDEVLNVLGNNNRLFVVMSSIEKEPCRKAGALLFSNLAKENVEEANLNGLEHLSEQNRFAFLEGMLLSSYHFDKYLNKKGVEPIKIGLEETYFTVERQDELLKLVNAVSFAKTLVNEPLNQLNALQFSDAVVEAGIEYGFDTEILSVTEIVKLGMGGLLGVNRGSGTPPTFNIMTYKPNNAVNSQPLVLVGKGVMFDTGGYSLKISGSMSGMKDDMGGGAAVLGTMVAIASNKLPYYVVGLVPATDNKISADALVVDDIITMMDGTTVEVQNTDAEGRLILGDALAYAKQYKPELVIDLATLTGAAAAITGSFGIAMVGNTDAEMEELSVSGEEVYERLIRLPFWKEFEDLLKSDIADLKNIGGPIGGATTAGKFLAHFTDYNWIHLDIAGAAFTKDKKGYYQAGATAVGVRLLYHFIKNRARIKN